MMIFKGHYMCALETRFCYSSKPREIHEGLRTDSESKTGDLSIGYDFMELTSFSTSPSRLSRSCWVFTVYDRCEGSEAAAK